MSDDFHRRNVEAMGREIELGLQTGPIIIPPYHTIAPSCRPTTRHIGALDGSDQQLFAYRANAELGIGIWASLYCEVDLQQGQETYRDGPPSALAWTEDELFMYHLTVALPDAGMTRKWRNDLYAIRQVLANTRVTEPPLFAREPSQMSVRAEAARERATGEWFGLRNAVIHQLAPGDLLLKDGRFNCQMEIPAQWVDEFGRIAARNHIHAIAIVKAGSLYTSVFPIVRAVAQQTTRPFWFVASAETIAEAYANPVYPERKTLKVGGHDERDLAGIGALWTVFCPDPQQFATFVIVEFNLYDLYHYRDLARTPERLSDWHARLTGQRLQSLLLTDLLIHPDHDLGELVEPTLAEVLWLCEQEIAHFGYPNLLGIAHRDVVLTQRKVAHLRQRYRDIFTQSDQILQELIDQDFLDHPHKLHHIS